ncbi:MAG: hypothetical protein ACPG47_00100 [Leucothrix sp.]
MVARVSVDGMLFSASPVKIEEDNFSKYDVQIYVDEGSNDVKIKYKDSKGRMQSGTLFKAKKHEKVLHRF